MLIICLSHIYYVDGVRGTDQYWYLADVTTLANGQPPLTNTVFPGDLLRSGESDHATYFAHNGPLLYINAVFARLTDSLTAWKYTNLVFFLLAAMFTGMTVSYVASVRLGYVSTIAFLATPINVWLASNFLQETFFSFLAAVILFTCVTDEGSVLKRILLLSALALGSLSHPLFLIVGIAYALILVIVQRVWLMPILVSATIVLATGLKDLWFPTSFPPTIKDLIAASVPGVANSIWQLSDTASPITVEFLLNKFKHALGNQFMPSTLSPLYLVSNAGLVALLFLLPRHGRVNRMVLYLSAVFMLSYAGMVVLMQNQVRYQLFITPIAIVCLTLWMSSWRNVRLSAGLFILVMAAYVLIDYTMLSRVRSESQIERAELVALKKELSFLGPDSRVALVANNLGGWLSTIYAVRPARAMPVFPDVLEEFKLAKVIRQFQPDYIFVRDNLGLDEVPEAEFFMSLKGVGPFDLDIYRMDSTAR